MLQHLDLDFKFDNIIHGFFNKQFLKSTHLYSLNHNHDQNEVLRNYELVKKDMAGQTIKTVNQIHSNVVCVVKSKDQDTYNIEADALVTNQPGTILGIYTADCVPIIFVDDIHKIAGIAHAGWKGAKSGIIENTLKLMQELGASIQDINAIIGPCIHQESYEVDENFLNEFTKQTSESIKYFFSLNEQGKYLFDLPGYVENILNISGLKSISNINHNTFAMPSFYSSYRRASLAKETYRGVSIFSAVMIK